MEAMALVDAASSLGAAALAGAPIAASRVARDDYRGVCGRDAWAGAGADAAVMTAKVHVSW